MSSKFYGLPKVHKPGNPLRPIVSSTGTATYHTAKELARILKPLVGELHTPCPYTRDFVEQIQETRLKQGECIISYDVAALFTYVPIQLSSISSKRNWPMIQLCTRETSMTIDHITTLLEFCFEKYQLCIPGAVLPTNGRCSYGKSTQSHSG